MGKEKGAYISSPNSQAILSCDVDEGRDGMVLPGRKMGRLYLSLSEDGAGFN